jgi:hypothetical protein
MIAILNNMEVSELVDQALREKLERMKQLEQYPEYKDVQGLHVQSERQKGGGPTQQVQPEDTVIHSARYEKAKSVSNTGESQTNDQSIFGKPIMAPLKNGQVEINLTLPELSFPTSKEKIVKGLKESIYQVQQTIPLNSDPEILTNLNRFLEILKMNLDIVGNLLIFDKKYSDIGQIEEEIIKAPKKRLADLHIKHRPKGTIGGCKIRWGPDIIKDRMGMRLIT